MSSKTDLPVKIDIPEFRLEDIPLSCTWIVVGQPSSGKCNGRGTEVISLSGELIKVEDVKIGDLLMGDDSTPRKVVKLFQGKDEMFKIIPIDGTDPYCITGGHTLCLKYNAKPFIKKEKGK